MAHTAPHHDSSLAEEIAAGYRTLPDVEAVALAGSRTSGAADPQSDIDLYVYTRAPIPVSARQTIATTRASRAEIDNQFWEPGDEWIECASGTRVDVMFRSVAWIEEQLARVLQRHEASVGYSTCFWHNVLTSQVVFDRHGWFHQLQQWANQPYPEPLRRSVVAKNYPILRSTQSSYLYQLERAVARHDLVSINHRIAALLASYFDVLFAVNRVPHPGEKRLIQVALRTCPMLPHDMPTQVDAVLRAIPASDQQVIAQVHRLLDGLDRVVQTEELLPSQGIGDESRG